MKKECLICNKSFEQQSGHFTLHLRNDHNMTLKDYVILTEYNGIPPRCKCGLCEDEPDFFRGSFKDYAKGHKLFSKKKELYLKKYGEPVCPTCGTIIDKWHRDRPYKYCSIKCNPGGWNQEKKDKTVKEKYGVDNVFQIPEIINRIQSSIDHKEIAQKAMETNMKRYGYKCFNPTKTKQTMLDLYGVEHISHTKEFRDNASNRMKESNPMYDKETALKVRDKNLKNYEDGTAFNIVKYNDKLYYQSSYEYEFLELCESLDILDKVENGKSYNYLNSSKRMLTDFTIGNTEIEIKSTYIMKLQGGKEVLDNKRKAVENSGSKYIVILDKDYSEFLEFVNNLK